MNRTHVAVAGSMIVVAGLVYAWSARGTDEPPGSAPAEHPAAPSSMPVLASPPAADAAVATAKPAEATVEQVAAWVGDTQGDDAGRRAAAIAALARAPRAAAIPALRQVLATGEAGVDWPLALKSLTQLALEQGDEDGAVRNVIREAIYHGDGGNVPSLAQDALDTVERELAQHRAAMPHG